MAKYTAILFECLLFSSLRIYSNHHDPGGGRAACCHDSHTRGEFFRGQCVLMVSKIASTFSFKFNGESLTGDIRKEEEDGELC